MGYKTGNYINILKKLKEEKENKNNEVYVVEDSDGKKVNQDRLKAQNVAKSGTSANAVYEQKWGTKTGSSTKKTTTKQEDNDTWFQSSKVFDDGYDFGDITKTILGTVGDIGLGVVKGVANIGEGIGDLGAYGVAGLSELFGNKEYAEQVRTKAQENLMDELFKPAEDIVEQASILGEKGDSVSQGLGYVGSIIATGGLGSAAGLGTLGTTALTTGLTGLSSMGSGMSEAYQGGATDEEALKYGIISGVAEAGSELIFGGLGKAVNAVGLSKGLSSLDDTLAKKISSKISSTLGKNIAEYTVKAGAEGVEEVVSGIAQGIGKKVTYMSDEELVDILKDEKLLDQFIVGAVTSGIAQAPGLVKTTNAGRDFVSGYTQNEQKVIDAEVENRVNEQQKTGIELTNKEISKIREEVETDFNKGYISTDTIENTLGKKLSAEQEADIEAQLNTLLQQSKTADPKQIAEIDEQMDILANQLQTSRSLDFSKDAYIQKSYQEKELRKEHYTYETTDNEKINKLNESASKYMNNTTRTHEMVDTVAKLVKDTDKQYEFINTEGIKALGYNIEGKKVNGLVTKDGKILINIDNDTKLLETVIGHETTHLLEGTAEYQALQDTAIEYAKTKGIYNDRIQALEGLYKGTNANIKAELTSDLTGELLFTDQSFIESLSAEQPNVFQKIYNYIKHIYKMATAGSKEARQLEELKYRFDQAYKKAGQQAGTDTKYSLTDNQGRPLSKEQQEYFKDSKARDENGNLEVVYHGTNKAGFMTFNRNYNFYSSSRDIAESYTRGTETVETQKDSDGKTYDGGIYEGYVNLKNPLIIDAHGENWSGIPLEYIGIENIEDVFRENGSSYFKEKGKIRASTNDIVEAIAESENFEYDGIIFRNITDRGMYFHKPVEDISSSVYVTFNSNQFKALDNTNPTTDPDIRYSLSEDGKMVDSKGNEVKLEAAEAGTHGTLMAIHNITDYKLRGVLELGGFPVPSIAITTPKLDFNNFGEVSVIFDKETINPTNKQNEVYGSDVYSPRFPHTVNKINEEGAKKVAKTLEMSPYEFESIYGTQPKEDVVRKLIRDEIVIDKYLESKNITVDPIYKTYSAEQSGVSTKYVENFLNTHEELQNADINIRQLDYDKYSEEVKQIYIDNLVEQGVSIEEAQDLYSNFDRYDITKFLIDVKNFKKVSGQGQEIDTYATKQAKTKHIDFYSDEYINFVENLIAPAFGDKYIRNNKDPFTPSGNRRNFNQLHDAYTLENVVKNMKGKVRGEEGFFYGAGTIRSLVTPQFKSIAEIKAREGKLVTTEQMKEVKQDIDSDLNNLSVTAGNFGGNTYDSYEVALTEIAELKRITFDKAKSILNDYGFKNVPDILVNKSIEFLEKLKNAPTEYFEAKPQRAVGLKEVQAIVVPNDMSADLKQQLYDNGLNVIEYDPNIEGDRQAKINELDDLKFSLSVENEIAPIGQRGTYGKDVRVEIEEAIAPLQETINNLSAQLDTVLNSTEQLPETAPVQEVQPTQPTLEEVQNLIDIRDNKSGSEYARAFFALRNKYGQAELYKSLNEYYSTGTVTQPSNVGDIDTAPVRQDIVEKQGQEAFNTITDNDAPKSFEDIVDEVLWNEDFESEPDSKVESPLDNRDIDEVGNRKVKAYQYENPDVKPYFQAEAQNMLYDLDNTIKGERIATQDEEGYITGWAGITRQTTEAIAYLKDNYGYSYDQIRQGLNKIIEDDGKENNAVSKRIEFMLDERLREGYTTSDGIPIPANEDYVNFLKEKQVTEYNKEAFNALTDEDMPLYEKIEPRELLISQETAQGNESIPMKQITAQNQNTEAIKGKQRKWVETSTESEVVNREILPDDLDQDKIMYQPITNKATLNTANVKLDSLGYEKAVEYFNNQILNKKTTVEDIALGERLIQEAIKNKDTKTAGELIQNVAILGTELGQKVQALSIIQRMTPEGQLKMIEKTINRNKVKGDKAFNDVNLTDDMRKKILDTYKEDGSYNQEELNKAVDEVKQEIADQMPSTMLDKVNSWRYLSMLGNPKTHIRNLVSNVAMKGTTAVKNAVARTIETIAPIENRTRTWKMASEDVTAYAQQTALEMKDIISGDSKYSETADIKAKREIFKNNVLNKLANLNSNLLEKEDWWFSKGAFESSFREFLTANGIETQQDIQNNPELIEKGKQYAVEQAQIATFRQYSWLANKIRDIESKNAATSIAVGAVLPFKKTPINIAKAGLSYSPLGFTKTLTYDIAQVKKGNMEASTLIDHLAQNTTGTALTLVGYMLAQAGFINGAGDDDKEGKYDYQLGKQSYSINIGGNTYSLSWLSPVAMPLFVGANAYEQLVEGEEWNPDVVLETLGQTLDPLSEMSFLSSLDSVLSSYDSGVQRFFGIGEAMLQNYVTQFVPTASSQLAATLDDTKRTTKVSGDSNMKVLEETYNKLIYKIPSLRETLEPTTDIWGNEVKQSEDLFTRAFENFIAPYSRKDSIATEIDAELKDLFSQTGDNGILPSIPSNYVNYDGERYDMSAKEYTDYKKTYGQTANDLLEDLFRTTTYKNATSEERTDMVNDVYDYARDLAKQEYLDKEGVEYTNATEKGKEVYKENLIKGAVENDMTTEEYGLYVDEPEEYKFLMEKDYEYRRKYFDTSDSLKEIENSFSEQKDKTDDDDELDALYSDKKTSITNKIINSGLEDTEKASLYKKYYNSDTVDTVMKTEINLDDYLTYETKEFKADKNEKGNSIPGSRKDKVIAYVNTLDMSIAQKAILIKSTNTFKFNDYNDTIVQYVDGLAIDYEDKVKILKDLDFEVDKEGNVFWD